MRFTVHAATLAACCLQCSGPGPLQDCEDLMSGFAAIGLQNPKSAVNVGAVLRAAACYDARLLAIRGVRYRRSGTDVSAAYRDIPLLTVDDLKTAIPYDCVPVAVDLIPGAISLPEYRHPQRAFYVFGPEDGTLGRSVTSWCRDVVAVPTRQCMNLAAAVNVVLYDRLAKHLLAEADKLLMEASACRSES